ncbi:unnamed protein product [Polarella glacialis]|uniref:EF-hand domain-containing protein n=1 Tax=Polarella glacialis TaxID=89957 RepID=A0A813IG79_POLGL|nr:unnamed protein product [Polarella glacialis]
MVLTFMLLYAASIVFTTLVGRGFIYDDDDAPEFESAKKLYGTLLRSFVSLFKLMNDDQSVVEPIIGTIGGQLLFYGFMCMSNWMMLAILTSVVSENMMSASRKIATEDTRLEEDLNRDSVKRRLMAVFKGLDTDNNGSLDEDEFYKMIQDDSLRSDLYDASGLEAEDLLDMFKCVSFLNKNGKRVLPYATFITCLNDAHKVCSQRSALHIMERLRAMEHRTEARLNKALVKLGVPEEELNELPSIDKNMREAQLEDQEEQETVKMLKVNTSRGSSKSPASRGSPQTNDDQE